VNEQGSEKLNKRVKGKEKSSSHSRYTNVFYMGVRKLRFSEKNGKSIEKLEKVL
jgi:hypothetical protein